MKIGALSLFNRTNSSHRFNLASWHSWHSLTWRWVLSVARQPFGTFKPYAVWQKLRNGHGGASIGLGQFISLIAYRHNDGWQFSASLLWLSIEFSQQPSMFYRHLYERQRDEELEADFRTQSAADVRPVLPDHPTLQ